MRNRIFFPLLIAFILFSCNKKQDKPENVVHLKGQIETTGNDEEQMTYDGASSSLGNSRDILLQLDAQGNFDTTFVLNEPAYFGIRRNTLYLSPGDDLTLKITSDNNEAEFSGIGAEVNTYMKGRLFPKGGSFLNGGHSITGDFMTTKTTIDSLAAIRQHQLDTLSNASDEFKRLEKARIKADIINSYVYYPFYTDYAKRKKIIDTIPDRMELLKTMTPFVVPILIEINDPTLLDVSVVREVFSFSADSTLNEMFFGDIILPVRTKELLAGKEEINKLRKDITPETANEVTQFTKALENKDFAEEIDRKISQASKLFSGQPAIDFELADTHGNIKHLSDFKGKIIYVDLWATWCGPCIEESPYFESLAGEFNPEEVAFIPISTDRDKKTWLDYLSEKNRNLAQFHSTDRALQEGWNLRFIPRFLLIDKDFKIVNAHASPPSSDETKLAINQLLEKKI